MMKEESKVDSWIILGKKNILSNSWGVAQGQSSCQSLGLCPQHFQRFKKALCFCLPEEPTVGLAVGGQRGRSRPCLYSALSKKSSEQN